MESCVDMEINYSNEFQFRISQVIKLDDSATRLPCSGENKNTRRNDACFCRRNVKGRGLIVSEIYITYLAKYLSNSTCTTTCSRFLRVFRCRAFMELSSPFRSFGETLLGVVSALRESAQPNLPSPEQPFRLISGNFPRSVYKRNQTCI